MTAHEREFARRQMNDQVIPHRLMMESRKLNLERKSRVTVRVTANGVGMVSHKLKEEVASRDCGQENAREVEMGSNNLKKNLRQHNNDQIVGTEDASEKGGHGMENSVFSCACLYNHAEILVRLFRRTTT